MSYRFEWDPAKSAANLKKHNVSFEEATTVFGDPLALNAADPNHTAEEERFLLLGLSIRQRQWRVCFRWSKATPMT
ncbi:MAG: BrnT family toxin [Longimicrobiales bacterium]